MLERVTEQLNYWLSDSYFDEKTKEELLAVRNDEKEIEDRFYKDLAFGTGGLRGVIGAGTNRMNIYTVRKATQGLANYINKNGDPKKGVAISYDSRRMSPEFAKETALCLAANGIKAYLSDTLRPVPEESFALRYFGCQAGVEITASHNPFHDNGIKLVNRMGEKMDDETIALIEDWLDHVLKRIEGDGEIPAFSCFGREWKDLPFAEGEKIGTTIDYIAGRNRYIGYLISLGVFDFRGMKVGLDCANGGSWSIAKAVFNALGAETYLIGDRPNGLNINRNVGSTHIEQLQDFVRDNRLDVGFAYDGDADRCLAVDEKGDVITGDHILYMYACYMKERGKLLENTVVATAQSNYGLFQALEEAGIDYVRTKVGDKYVYEAMKQNGYRIGGEQTGHIIFSKYSTTGDGVLTSLKVMQVMLAKKKKLSELAAPLHLYPQVQYSVRVADKERVMRDPDVLSLLDETKGHLERKGSLLVRPSGTEPVIRVGVEAETGEEAKALADAIADRIRKSDGQGEEN